MKEEISLPPTGPVTNLPPVAVAVADSPVFPDITQELFELLSGRTWDVRGQSEWTVVQESGTAYRGSGMLQLGGCSLRTRVAWEQLEEYLRGHGYQTIYWKKERAQLCKRSQAAKPSQYCARSAVCCARHAAGYTSVEVESQETWIPYVGVPDHDQWLYWVAQDVDVDFSRIATGVLSWQLGCQPTISGLRFLPTVSPKVDRLGVFQVEVVDDSRFRIDKQSEVIFVPYLATIDSILGSFRCYQWIGVADAYQELFEGSMPGVGLPDLENLFGVNFGTLALSSLEKLRAIHVPNYLEGRRTNLPAAFRAIQEEVDAPGISAIMQAVSEYEVAKVIDRRSNIRSRNKTHTVHFASKQWSKPEAIRFRDTFITYLVNRDQKRQLRPQQVSSRCTILGHSAPNVVLSLEAVASLCISTHVNFGKVEDVKGELSRAKLLTVELEVKVHEGVAMAAPQSSGFNPGLELYNILFPLPERECIFPGIAPALTCPDLSTRGRIGRTMTKAEIEKIAPSSYQWKTGYVEGRSLSSKELEACRKVREYMGPNAFSRWKDGIGVRDSTGLVAAQVAAHCFADFEVGGREALEILSQASIPPGMIPPWASAQEKTAIVHRVDYEAEGFRAWFDAWTKIEGNSALYPSPSASGSQNPHRLFTVNPIQIPESICDENGEVTAIIYWVDSSFGASENERRTDNRVHLLQKNAHRVQHGLDEIPQPAAGPVHRRPTGARPRKTTVAFSAIDRSGEIPYYEDRPIDVGSNPWHWQGAKDEAQITLEETESGYTVVFVKNPVSTTLCRGFANGACTFGDRCRFTHTR
jgi:hypothetical protein